MMKIRYKAFIVINHFKMSKYTWMLKTEDGKYHGDFQTRKVPYPEYKFKKFGKKWVITRIDNFMGHLAQIEVREM